MPINYTELRRVAGVVAPRALRVSVHYALDLQLIQTGHLRPGLSVGVAGIVAGLHTIAEIGGLARDFAELPGSRPQPTVQK